MVKPSSISSAASSPRAPIAETEAHDLYKPERGISDQVESIASLYDLSLLAFTHVLNLLQGDPVPNEFGVSDLQDQLGRFRIWAGNHGAHRKPTDPLSLDHRLREEQSLHQGVRNRLLKIIEILNGGKKQAVSLLVYVLILVSGYT